MNPESPVVEFSRAVVKAWERLRLIYNGIMLVAGAIVIWRTLALQKWLVEHDMVSGGPSVRYPIAAPEVLAVSAVAFGVMANICFCLGPYAEIILASRGVPLTGERIRKFIFAMGVLLSLGLVGLVWVGVKLIADFSALAMP